MTPQQEQRLKYVEQLLETLVKSDRYVFDKTLQLSDGRKIQLGRSTGTTIGTAADQKLSFYGVTPVVQAGSITTPSSAGSSYSQSQANAVVTAVTAIITALKNAGLTA